MKARRILTFNFSRTFLVSIQYLHFPTAECCSLAYVESTSWRKAVSVSSKAFSNSTWIQNIVFRAFSFYSLSIEIKEEILPPLILIRNLTLLQNTTSYFLENEGESQLIPSQSDAISRESIDHWWWVFHLSSLLKGEHISQPPAFPIDFFTLCPSS